MRDVTRILVLGDSIVEGEGSLDGRGWVGILREKYWSKGVFITNLGISGDTTTDILRRTGIIYSYHPDIIILAVGINDACIPTKIDNKPMSSIEDFRAHMYEILNKCGQQGTEIRIIGLTRVDESRVQPLPGSRSGKSYSNELIAHYDAELESIALDYDCRYISVAGILSLADLFDGLHPSSEGYEKLAHHLEPFVIEKL